MEIVSTSPDNTSKMVAYADDFTAGDTVKDLKYWWETLCEFGPKQVKYGWLLRTTSMTLRIQLSKKYKNQLKMKWERNTLGQ